MKILLRAVRYLGSYWPIAFGAIFSLIMVTVANLVSPQIGNTRTIFSWS
jgi:hypothetical protein